ncbi:hypothetical protein LCGC14_1231260, partial [marine sediment metagenome]
LKMDTHEKLMVAIKALQYYSEQPDSTVAEEALAMIQKDDLISASWLLPSLTPICDQKKACLLKPQ